MLLMMNLDSTVWGVEGVKHQEGEHEGRKAMHKICAALNKEKGIASLTKSVTILITAKSQLNAAVIINHTLDFVKTLVTPKNCVALNKEKSISVNPTI